jgi:hypothetical protein
LAEPVQARTPECGPIFWAKRKSGLIDSFGQRMSLSCGTTEVVPFQSKCPAEQEPIYETACNVRQTDVNYSAAPNSPENSSKKNKKRGEITTGWWPESQMNCGNVCCNVYQYHKQTAINPSPVLLGGSRLPIGAGVGVAKR